MKSDRKKRYKKPKIVSGKVFEQAALACSASTFGNLLTNLKQNAEHCGMSSS